MCPTVASTGRGRPPTSTATRSGFERYPRLDDLVEVEGEPTAIEAAILVLALPRETFTTGRLPDFVRDYEARTGQRAALCDRELDGDYRYSATDA